MAQSSLATFPNLAPLAVPVAYHLIAHQSKNYRYRPPVEMTLQEELRRVADVYHTEWDLLTQKVQTQRADVYKEMDSVVPNLSTDWIQEALTDSHPVSAPTISRWREAGLLCYQQGEGGEELRNRHHPDSVGALLIAARIDPRSRGWLPEKIPAGVPRWYCWRQDGPDNPIMPCPIPLPPDLPEGTVLWTPWAGAAWEPNWLGFGKAGAIRFARTRVIHGKCLWSLSEAALKTWDPDTFYLGEGILAMAPEVLDNIARMILLKLAFKHLGTPAAPFSLGRQNMELRNTNDNMIDY